MPEEKNLKCNCRWKKCIRHGKCDECKAHHVTHVKYPLPYCERKKPVKPKKTKLEEDMS